MVGAMHAAEPAFDAYHRELWGLCYRMTGVAADADELVQETFLRAMERPPRRPGPLGPWLRTVAMNLARDRLRRRRRRTYVGPWLPSPVDVADLVADTPSPEGRYSLSESLSFAFLLALEALTPQQRAVLLLRDVFDLSAAETGACLSMSDANVRVTLHRARRRMTSYDTCPAVVDAAGRARAQAALASLLSAVAAGDLAQACALFAGDAVALSDGAGEFHASRVPLLGPARIVKFYAGIARTDRVESVEVRLLNGLPVLVGQSREEGRHPRRWVQAVHVDDAGRIVGLYSVVATRKLTAVFA